MAVFTAANANVAVNMYELFAFAPPLGTNTIDDIQVAPGVALVSDFPPSVAVPPFSLLYSNTNNTEVFGKSGLTPESGSFNKIEIKINDELRGTLSGITPGLGNFGEIDQVQAYKALLGNDTITGSNKGDILYTGEGGTDTVDGKGGDDVIDMGATAFAPFHSLNGGTGHDTIRAFGNLFSADKVLDLRNATLQSIEAIDIEGGATVRLLGSQIGAGFVSPAALVTKAIDTANGVTLEVVLDVPGAANLSGFTVGAGVSIKIFGSAGGDEITGSGMGETISGDAGADTIRGGLGPDTMFGGAGGDRFDFDAVAEIGKKKGMLDLISDWGAGDRIDLSTIDANGTKKGDKAFKFLKKEGADFTKAGQVGFDQKKGNTFVQGDTNGDGKADFKLQIAGEIDLAKGDFVL